MNSPCLFLQRLGVEDLRLPGPPTLRDIALTVARRHGLTLEQIRGPRRFPYFVHARHEGMALSYATGEWSNGQISSYYGGRDHTTTNHARRAYAKRQAAAMAMAAE